MNRRIDIKIQVFTAILLCAYLLSLFPLNILHHHDTHCEKENIAAEHDLCHQAIYHIGAIDVCSHKSHIIPLLNVCKNCKYYFSTHSELVVLDETSFYSCNFAAQFSYQAFFSNYFLPFFSNKGPPLEMKNV